MDILKIIVNQYERGKDMVPNGAIPKVLGCSRIIYDVHLQKLIKEGLVFLSSGGHVYLQDKGKRFAINQGLIS